MSGEQQERRRSTDSDMDALKTMIADLDHKLSEHIQKVNEYEPKVVELITWAERSKGVVWFLRTLLYIGAPIAAAVYWIKDHVKL